MNDEEMRKQLREQGLYAFPTVLTKDEIERVSAALDRGVEREQQIMGSTHIKSLELNEANIQVAISFRHWTKCQRMLWKPELHSKHQQARSLP